MPVNFEVAHKLLCRNNCASFMQYWFIYYAMGQWILLWL